MRIHGTAADKPISIDCPDRSHCPGEINSLIDRLEAAALAVPVPEHPPARAVRAIDLTWEQHTKPRPAARDSQSPAVRQLLREPGRLVVAQPGGAPTNVIFNLGCRQFLIQEFVVGLAR